MLNLTVLSSCWPANNTMSRAANHLFRQHLKLTWLAVLFAGQLAASFGADTVTLASVQTGQWRIDYHLADGTADICYGGKILIPRAYAVVKLPAIVTSRDYPFHKTSRETVSDRFGRGVKFTVESTRGDADKMIQTFCLYEKLDYLLAGVSFARRPGAESNFMSPLTTETAMEFPPGGDNRALSVPFDNDQWIRYQAVPFGTNVTSYEISALYDNTSRQALVIGSIDHDFWKTGVISTTTSNAVTSLQAFGGITSDVTHDVLPHGRISGPVIQSPRMFIGRFADWRDGLETYAHACALVAPPRPWKGGVPFGWNSWGKLQKKISFTKAVQVSDFFARELPGFKNDGVVYIGLDSGWTKFSDVQLKAFVEHCHSNHQEAGIYFTPFSQWNQNGDTPVAGTDYKLRDLYLLAGGRPQVLDGGTALDSTHPGTRKLIADTIAKFKLAGFKYVKADFLTHGALEADRYFDPRVTTGIQAYNAGMQYVAVTLGRKIYLNESISPLFPAQYANSRRIACDSYGGISETEYMLNSLTFGWWLSGVYDFNDADHVVLDGHSEGENRARATSSVITGIFISGDDFSDRGSTNGKVRAKKILGNADIAGLARIKKAFRPVEGNTGTQAARLFYFQNGRDFYVAAFNYTDTRTGIDLPIERLGLGISKPVLVKELWSGTTNDLTGSSTIYVNGKDACLYRFVK